MNALNDLDSGIEGAGTTTTKNICTLCRSCETFVVNLLFGDTHSNGRWEMIESEHATLSYPRSRLHKTVQGLQRSGEHGCQVCRLTSEDIHKFEDMDPANSYNIFIWGTVPDVCKFHIAVGDITSFIEHVSRRKTPPSLVIWGGEMPTSTLPILPYSNRLNYDDRPTLSTLPNTFQGSPESFRKARQWLAECQNRHQECARVPSKLPKRVLYLGGENRELTTVALYITSGEVQPYVALSYAWGESERLVTMRNPNASTACGEELQFPADYLVGRQAPSHQSGQRDPVCVWVSRYSADSIPLEAFPETLSDAIHIARILGFQYLWIDSLCIWQGDIPDWADQGAAMTDIYGGATLVISATSAQNCQQKMLKQSESVRIGIGTLSDYNPTEMQTEIFIGRPMKTLDLEEESLSTRGWVFQERLVSTATLHYIDEGMVWECAHGTQVDCNQNISDVVRWKSAWRDIMSQSSSDFPPAYLTSRAARNRYNAWYDWVSAYSERDLTEITDKFPAMAGVAKKLAQKNGLIDFPGTTNEAYVAGLWKEDFEAGLLWRRQSRTKSLTLLQDKFVAPSWSWGSVKGRLEYRKVVWVDSISKKGSKLTVFNSMS